jgi:transposase
MSKRDELFQRKRCAMELMDAGMSWREANVESGLEYSKSGIQHLYREWGKRGEEALVDHRGGSRYRKATAEVQEKMINLCRENEEIRAPELTAEIKAEFGVELNPRYVSELRRQLGLPVPRPGRPKRAGAIPTSTLERGEDFPPRGGNAPSATARCGGDTYGRRYAGRK